MCFVSSFYHAIVMEIRCCKCLFSMSLLSNLVLLQCLSSYSIHSMALGVISPLSNLGRQLALPLLSLPDQLDYLA